jgi:hypothetical protein
VAPRPAPQAFSGILRSALGSASATALSSQLTPKLFGTPTATASRWAGSASQVPCLVLRSSHRNSARGQGLLRRSGNKVSSGERVTETVMARPRDNSLMTRERSSRATAEATLEFGRFRVLLRQRQLGRRRRADNVGNASPRSSPGLAGGRWIAGHQRRADEPCVARYCGRGR